MSQTSCGLIVVDPFDFDLDCCTDVDQPVRPTEVAEANLTLTNEEEVPVEGEVVWELADPSTDEVLVELGRESFTADSGEAKGFEIEFTPEEVGYGDIEANYRIDADVRNVVALEDEIPGR